MGWPTITVGHPADPWGGTMRITCEKWPSLLITHPRVEFVDGVAEADEETVRALGSILEEWGIDAADIGGEHAEGPEDPEAPESPEEPESPKRGRGRG